MDVKNGASQWSSDSKHASLTSSQNYCYYQQKYPTRLPKLVKKGVDSKKQRPSLNRQFTVPLEQKQMPAEENATNGFFSKRELNKSDKDKILEKTGNLLLEEYLDEDSIVEPFQLPIASLNHVKKSKSKRKDSLKSKQHQKQQQVGNALPQSLQRRLSSSPKTRRVSDAVDPARKMISFKQRSHSLQEEPKMSSKNRPKSVKYSKNSRSPIQSKTGIINAKQFIKTLQQCEDTSEIVAKSLAIDSSHSAPAMHKNKKQSKKQKEDPEERYNNGDIEPIKSQQEMRKHSQLELQRSGESEMDLENEKIDKVESEMRKLELNVVPSIMPDWLEQTLEDDKQMVLLENPNSKILPQRDIDDKLQGRPISYCVAKNLRFLLFGQTENSFSLLWRQQTIEFYKTNHYGLRYFKDGPTEIMVSIQAVIMKYLLFLNIEPVHSDLAERLFPSEKSQERVLCLALSDMLWKCGDKKTAVVALPIGNCTFISESSYKEDRITEKMELFKFTNSDELEKFIRRNLKRFQENGGCISFLYSMMLSRGLNRLLEDFRELRHGLLQSNQDSLLYRSQALMNLGICGQAIPNIFNGECEYFDIMENRQIIQKGIKKRNEIGFLTHEEFTDPKNFQVGSCLKTPFYPIWVAKNNSRLCVLFCLKKDLTNDWKQERRFDLYHYQGIPRHVGFVNLDVKLTIDTVIPYESNDNGEEEETSTLEETIRTKWNDAVIGWNGFIRF